MPEHDAANGTSDETVGRDEWIDAACDRFEDRRLSGRAVSVEDFLRAEGLDPANAAPTLVRELARLHAHYVRPDATRSAPVAPESGGDSGVRPGAVLAGRYKLIERIGGGGMGDVWMARQLEPVRRVVAVKVIRDGRGGPAVLARFEAERQALAVMDHPNIAKVLDAGAMEGGRPYFVMELVKGVPITQFCDERKLTPRQRLELFVPVCLAVQHAHQKGVIHRDIKPGNVLVALHDDRPVPVVIDFGIAKATGEPLTDRSLDTGFGAIVGTPEYMSPEQATVNQRDIDTRSDVYSLGVLLYELLTGTTPVDRKSLADAMLLEVLRIVREVDAPRPSAKLSTSDTLPGIAANRGTEPKRLARMYRGELDWVLLKALEKDRERRYQSANAFAADLQRHLADEVVEARPPSAGYRLRKFVRRNRPQVIAGALVFLALVAGVIGTTLGLLEAQRQRGEAEEARGKEAARAEGEKQAKEDAEAKRVEAVFQQGVAEAASAKAIKAAELEAAARKKEEAERRHAEAIAEFVREDFFALTSLEGQSRFAGSDFVRLNPNLTLRQMLDRAATKLDKRTDIAPRTEADLRWMLGVNYRGQEDYPKAVAQLERCVSLREKALGADDRETLSALNSLALCYGMLGRLDRAVPLLETVVAGVEKRLGPDNDDTLSAVGNLAVAYRRSGNPVRAIPLLERVLKAEQIRPGPAHPRTLVTMDNLAAAYQQLRQWDAAIRLHEQAVAGLRVKPGPDHPDTIIALRNLAEAFTQSGQLRKALPSLQMAHDSMARLFGADDPDTLDVLLSLGFGYWSTGQLDRSIPAYEDALPRCRSTFGKSDPRTLTTAANLAVNYLDAGRIQEAIPLLEQAYGAANPENSLQWAGRELLDAYLLAGKREQAARHVERLLAEARKSLPKASLRLVVELSACGYGLLGLRKFSEAEAVLRESLEVRERLQPNAWSTFHTQSMLGAALLGQKKFATAEPHLLKGYEGMKAREKAIPPQGIVRLVESIDALIVYYAVTNKPEEVKRWRAERAKYPNESAPPPRPAK